MGWDLTLSMKDIIYVLALVLSGGIAWGAMIKNNGNTERRLEKVEKDVNDKNSKYVRIDLFQDLKSDLLRIEKKIDIQQDRCFTHFSKFPKVQDI